MLFCLLILTAFATVKAHGLFGVVMLSGVFSLLSALLLITLDAVDVAFTEAAVGAGISIVLMLSTLTLTSRREKKSKNSNLIPLVIVTLTGLVLIYGTLDMPNFGAADTPSQMHVAREYIKRTPEDIHIPNIVTAILGSYRGYDTLGETAVIFTAGIGVLLILGRLSLRPRRRAKKIEKVL